MKKYNKTDVKSIIKYCLMYLSKIRYGIKGQMPEKYKIKFLFCLGCESSSKLAVQLTHLGLYLLKADKVRYETNHLDN